MGLINYVFMLFLSVCCISSTIASTCEETETSHVKLDLAKQSIISAKLLYPKCEAETNDSNCTEKDRSLAHLNAALDLISEAKNMCHSCPQPKVIEIHDAPMDCSEIRSKGLNKSGVYQIYPRYHGAISTDVYCDMETDGGGWTVIQRRGDFPTRTDFYRDWESYKIGFGDLQQEFWLGNEKILALTKQGNYSARFDLVDVKREYRYAAYDSFSIGDESCGYILHIKNHTGNATNDVERSHGVMFSTKDRQNDKRAANSACADKYKSAFWFQDVSSTDICSDVNINGVYQPGVSDVMSIWWHKWKRYECLYSVEFKIRRKNF